MAAQNIGAGRWDRVDRITASGIAISVAVTSSVIGLILAFDRPVMTLFLDPASPAIGIARHIQLLSSWNFVLFGVAMVFFSTVRANGAVLAPLAILIVAMYPVRIGFALAMRPVLGPDALWWSFPLGSAASCAMAGLYYRHGGWRRDPMPRKREGHEARGHLSAGEEPAGMSHTTTG